MSEKKEIHVWDFMSEFVAALETQQRSDQERWGDTWLERTREGQEERIFDRIDGYHEDWEYDDIAVPWLKVAGLAMIAWLRGQHPEIWPK